MIRKIKFKIVLLVVTQIFTTLGFAQTMVSKGTVTDDLGAPIMGASVVVKGANNKGTTTDDKGNYSLPADKGMTIAISAIGFLPKEIKITSASAKSISLTRADKSLGEVVVIGYGTQRKEAVTGSVASISGANIREVPSPDLSQALQGRIAGVEISQTSSQPGASMQILIRGARSLTASNDPLIVLDGIPFVGSITNISPSDIKSIDILKDASATAIYGSRGANGVILISTNRGQRGGKARIAYNAYFGPQTLFAKYPMMNGPQFVALRKAAGLYTNGVDEYDSLNTDWQKLFYRTGFVNNHDISVSGGSETGSYNFGGGYYQNQGLIPTQQYKRYSMRASIDQQIGKYFHVGFTTNNNYNITQGGQVGVGSVLSNSPLASPYNADGSLKRTIQMPLDNSFVFTKGVIDSLKDQWLNETRGFGTYNSVYLEVKIPGIEGLRYRTNLGLDFIQSNNGNYTGQGIGSSTPTTLSSAGVSNSQTYHWTMENILTYDRTFKKHSLNIVGLYSAEQNKYNMSSMSATGIPSDAFQFYNLGQATGQITVDPNAQSYQLSGLVSYMGRVMYSYDNRFLLSATIRSDASSRLAPGHQWHTYPALSAGWNIANESFMKSITAINKLKLRVGYGQTSNQAIAPYATLGKLTTSPYNFGSTNYAVGYYVSQLPNANLGWEYSETWNYGLDFSLLKNRLSGTLEYYVTNTKDILLNVSLPSTAGVSSYTGNIGQTQNKGIELSLNGTILDNHNGWTWDAGVNFYRNRNKLVSLASGETEDIGNGWFVGHNINAIYDYKKIGLWATAKDSASGYLKTLERGGNVGMIRVEYTGGYNADGTPVRAIGAADQQIMDVDPKFEGGFNTRVAYKGFDFTVVGVFKSGGILVSTLYGSAGYLNLLTGRRNNINVDYWTPTNTNALYPKPGGILSGDNPKYGSTLMYFDASYLKFRAISLGYNFSRSVIKSSAIQFRMYATVQNPFVMFSPYHKASGMDPETNSYGNQNAAVPLSYNLRRILTIGTNAPATRTFLVGLNLTF